MTEEQIIALALEHEVLVSMDLAMGPDKRRALNFAKAIYNQALGDAADICASIVADCDASNRQVAMAAGAIRCEDAIRALKSAR